MTVKTYVSVNGKTKEIKGFLAKKNGEIVRIDEVYANLGGNKQLIFKAPSPPFPTLEITTATDISYDGIKLPKATFGEEYNAKIQATGGTGVYRFFIYRGALPRGLALSSNGVIFGVPTQGGMLGGIYFGVEDSAGNVSKRKEIVIRISAKTVNFTIKKNYTVYNGQPQKPEVVPDLDYITSDDYDVTVDGSETQIDSGIYSISVKVTKYGHTFGGFLNTSTLRSFHIDRNPSSKISLVSQTFTYDGQPHGLKPVVEPDEIKNDYKVTYVGINGTVYEETEQPPIAVGTYTVKAETTSKNYTVRTATATLTIIE